MHDFQEECQIGFMRCVKGRICQTLNCLKVDLGFIAKIPAYAAGSSAEIKQKTLPTDLKKKTDFTIWNTYLYHLVRKLSLAAWTFKQQPFHFELLNSETPADWKKAKDSYIHVQ